MADRLTVVHTPERNGATGYYRDPTPADLASHVAALPAEKRVALLVALLRACPDEAVAAVDGCKVARAWDPHCSRRYGLNWAQAAIPLGAAFAPLGYDAALLADGWVLAGVSRG